MRRTLAILAFALATMTMSAAHADFVHTPLSCNSGDYMVGIGGRVGNWINQIYPICAHFNPSTADFGPTYTGTEYGDQGGAPKEDRCGPRNIVTHTEWKWRRDYGHDYDDGSVNATARMQYVAFSCTAALFLFAKDNAHHGIASTVPEDGSVHWAPQFSDCAAGQFGIGLDALAPGAGDTTPYRYATSATVKCGPAPQAETASLPPGAKKNTDYFGSDIAGSGPLSTNDPTTCYNKCVANSNCLAWTYVHPGVQGPSAVCYLKNPVPVVSTNNCCISGIIPMRQIGTPFTPKNKSIFKIVNP